VRLTLPPVAKVSPTEGVDDLTTSCPTRSACTPVTVLAIEGPRMLVSELEALDETPVLDVKPVI
jgi:tRNA (Thr-GGU) A37 N-methylase